MLLSAEGLSVGVADVTAAYAYVGIYGPEARKRVAKLTGMKALGPRMMHQDVFMGLGSGALLNFTMADTEGVELLCASDMARTFFSDALASIPIGGAYAFDALRLSALRLWPGHEIEPGAARPDMLPAWDSAGSASQTVYVRVLLEDPAAAAWGGEPIVIKNTDTTIALALAAYPNMEGSAVVALVRRELIGSSVDVIVNGQRLAGQIDISLPM